MKKLKQKIKELDESEYWEKHNEELKIKKESWRDKNTKELLEVFKNHQIRNISLYCIRIDGVLDVWITHRKYHFIPKNKRGTFNECRDLKKFLKYGYEQ